MAEALEPLEVAVIGALTAAAPNFLRGMDLVQRVPGLTLESVRHVARRLQRRLAARGEASVLEICDRRGYRVVEP